MTIELDVLILTNIADIQRAYDRLTGDISKKIAEKIDRTLRDWANSNGWKIDKESFQDGPISVWPPDWQDEGQVQGGDDSELYAWFKITCVDDTDWVDNWLLNICAVGEYKEVGVLLEVDINNIGTSRGKWNNYIKEMAPIAKLQECGFNAVKGGKFFHPFTVNLERLVESFRNDTLEDALETPIQEALNAAKKAMPLFDTLISEAKERLAGQ